MEIKINFKKVDTGKRRCRICGYIYDPKKGDPLRNISPGIYFEDLPDSWRCPVCKYQKWQFWIILEEPPIPEEKELLLDEN
ncbi:MAG: rubredoxin [Aquificae bacterium]|nr:rubredoxin [Aquificota bacterium]